MALLDQALCVVDVETWMPRGSGGGGRHRLIEIAAAVVDIDGKPARGGLDAAGRSLARGPALIYQELCRPEDLPTSPGAIKLHNAIDPRWLLRPGVRSESVVVRDFVEWHYAVALSSPLIAYNNAFDKAAIKGALHACGARADLQWGRCLMLAATEALMLRKADGKIRRKAPKSLVAARLFDADKTLSEMAKAVGWTGPLTMHLGLPDVLLEVAILVAIKRQEHASRLAASPVAEQARLLGEP